MTQAMQEMQATEELVLRLPDEPPAGAVVEFVGGRDHGRRWQRVEDQPVFGSWRQFELAHEDAPNAHWSDLLHDVMVTGGTGVRVLTADGVLLATVLALRDGRAAVTELLPAPASGCRTTFWTSTPVSTSGCCATRSSWASGSPPPGTPAVTGR